MAQSVSRPITISDTLRNICPAGNVDLNLALGSKPGTNQVIEWRKDASPSPIVISQPGSVIAGTYRAYHRNTDTNQWSQASDPVVVIINNCTGLSVTSLPCNQTIPFTSDNFTGLTARAYTKAEGILPICTGYASQPLNLLDSSSSTYASLGYTLNLAIAGTCHAGFAVKGPTSGDVYPAGTYVGFHIKTSELLAIGLRSLYVRTFKNGAIVQSKIVSSTADLLTLNLLGNPGSYTVGFQTTLSFDEFAIEAVSTVGAAFNLSAYYPVIGNYCAGPSLKPNVLTPMNNNVASTYVVSERTGMHGNNINVSLGSKMADINALVSPSTTDYVDVSMLAGVGNRITASVKDAKKTYPAGTFAGFTVESSSLAGIQLINNTKLRFYRNGLKVDSVNNGGLLEVNSSLLGSSGQRLIGFKSRVQFDEVQLEVQSLASLLTNLKIYNLTLQRYESGTLDDCNELTRLTNPEHPVMVEGANTKIAGACVGCSITDVQNVINESPDEYASINVVASLLGAKASLSVKNQIDNDVYPGGSFAGFEIENTTLVDISLLNSLKIATYKDGILVQEKSGSSELLSLDLLGTGNVTGRRTVGFVTNQDFDEIVIEQDGGLLTVSIGTLKVYNAVIQTFCTPPTLDCNVEYVLNSTDFPAIVNHERTGRSGIACALTSVSNTANLLDGNENTHATISLPAGVGCGAAVSIQSINSVYPAGSSAGFIITNPIALAEVDLLEALTISTYKNGVLREFGTIGGLLHLNILGLLGGPTKARVFIKTTMDYDEVRLQVGSLASVLNTVHVFGTFVNTRGSNDSTLSCCAADGHTPTLVSLEDVNQCPDEFASLTSNISNTCPVGTVLQWHTTNVIANFSTSTRVTNPDTVTTPGTYYAVCYDSVLDCYSDASAGIEIDISECCPVISITPATNVHPTSCGLQDGSITIEGLRVNQTGYTLTYRKDGSTLVTIPNLTANSQGHLVISNLGAGEYTDIQVFHAECTGTNVLSTTLVDQTKPASPTNLQSNPTAVCANVEFTLSGTCPAGSTISWFTDLALTTPVGASPLTLASSTPFYAACVTGTCVSDPVRLDVVVTPIPTPPTGLTLSRPTICAGQSSVLSATCASGSVVWYDNIAMTTPINAEVYPLAGTHTYYARCENGTCKSTHEFIELTVNPSYPAPTLQATQLTIKSDETSTLSGSCTSGTLIWSNTEAMDNTFTNTTVSPDVTTTYYAACGPAPCAAVTPITITVEEDIFDLALRLLRAPGTPALVKHNDNVQLNVLVINKGNINATDVGVVVYVPQHLTVADPNWNVVGQKAYLINKIASIAGGDTTTVSINLTVDSTAINAIVVAAEISEAEGGVDINSTPDDNPTNDTFPNPPVAGGNLNGTKENDYDEVTLTVCQTGTCITAKYKRVK